MIVPTSSSPIFVYGTLMAPEVLQVLIGRIPTLTQPAFIRDYRRWRVKGYRFPGLIPSHVSLSSSMINDDGNTETPKPSTFVRGMLLDGLSSSEQCVFDWFEDDAYSLDPVDIWIPKDLSNTIDLARYPDINDSTKWQRKGARAYIWANPLEELAINEPDGEWNYERFREEHLNFYLNEVVIPCRKELDRLGIGLLHKS